MRPISSDFRAQLAGLPSPSELFIELWRLASSWEPADRELLPQPLLTTRNELAAAILYDEASKAVATFVAIINSDWPVEDQHLDRMMAAGLLLEGMRAIEHAFMLLHPRTRTVPPSMGSTGHVPSWLEDASRRRFRHGSYAEWGAHRLIPSGPFSRYAPGRNASAANALQDYFPFLTVAPKESEEQGRKIVIDIKVVGTDAMRGVPAAKSIGRERVRFIPLAEAKDDLAFQCFERSGKPVLDVRPNIDTAARLLVALEDASDIDIAFAPELTVPGDAEDAIRDGITRLADFAPRIILAGSGLSVEKGDCGRAWNEARVFSRGGKLLWRQRKIWPYGMQPGTARRYGLKDPGEGGMLMEDIAGNSKITIVDIDGFGRSLVLICQDFQAHPVVEDVVARYQPDWIFTPVLDLGVKISGWAHMRALILSKLSQARVLVGSSLTLRFHSTPRPAEPAIGLAVGPADPTKGPDGKVAPSRAVALVRAAKGASPRSGLLVWDHVRPPWKQTKIRAD